MQKLIHSFFIKSFECILLTSNMQLHEHSMSLYKV